MHCVWQHLEQWSEVKKRVFDSNLRIKINVREFNATQGVMEQRLLGGLVLFSYDKHCSAL